MQGSWWKSSRGSTGKRTKKLGDRSRTKKKKSSIEGYQGDTRRSSSMDRETGNMKERGRGDGTKIGPDGNIPWDEES